MGCFRRFNWPFEGHDRDSRRQVRNGIAHAPNSVKGAIRPDKAAFEGPIAAVSVTQKHQTDDAQGPTPSTPATLSSKTHFPKLDFEAAVARLLGKPDHAAMSRVNLTALRMTNQLWWRADLKEAQTENRVPKQMRT